MLHSCAASAVGQILAEQFAQRFDGFFIDRAI
jgi:hypothetical protein